MTISFTEPHLILLPSEEMFSSDIFLRHEPTEERPYGQKAQLRVQRSTTKQNIET